MAPRPFLPCLCLRPWTRTSPACRSCCALRRHRCLEVMVVIDQILEGCCHDTFFLKYDERVKHGAFQSRVCKALRSIPSYPRVRNFMPRSAGSCCTTNRNLFFNRGLLLPSCNLLRSCLPQFHCLTAVCSSPHARRVDNLKAVGHHAGLHRSKQRMADGERSAMTGELHGFPFSILFYQAIKKWSQISLIGPAAAGESSEPTKIRLGELQLLSTEVAPEGLSKALQLLAERKTGLDRRKSGMEMEELGKEGKEKKSKHCQEKQNHTTTPPASRQKHHAKKSPPSPRISEHACVPPHVGLASPPSTP